MTALVLTLVLGATTLAVTTPANVTQYESSEMRWQLDDSGLEVGIPVETQRGRSDGALDVVLGLRNVGTQGVYCSTSPEQRFVQMSDGRGHTYASFFPNDQNPKRVPIKTEINPGESIFQRVSLTDLVGNIAPGSYDVSFVLFCGGDSDPRILWRFRLEVEPPSDG